MISRRRVLHLAAGGGAAVAAMRVRLAVAAPPRRVAALDWAALETALAMDVEPVAAAELRQYAAICTDPAPPAGVTDIGLRGAPNYELLRMVAPDLILTSNFYARQAPSLEAIAPTLSLPIYEAGRQPYAAAEVAALTLGEALGRRGAARTLIARGDATLRAARAALPMLAERPVFIINVGDSRHVRAFGPDSMFGDVLARLGGRNAWTAASRYSATAPVGIEALARVPDAAIVIVGPTPPDARRALADGAIWKALPMVREGRVVQLPPVNHYGGLPAACRFVRCLVAAMADAEAIRG